MKSVRPSLVAPVLAILAMCVALSTPALAQELVLRAVEDSYVNNNFPNMNFDRREDLRIGNVYCWDLGYWRAFVRFDLTQVERTPVMATLELYQHTGSGGGGVACMLHQVLGAWSQSTVTWGNQPIHDPETEDAQEIGSVSPGVWVRWDATKIVHRWLDDKMPNDGFLLKQVEYNAGACRYGIFHSLESTRTDLRPRLVLSFEGPTAARPLTWGRLKSMYR